MQMMFVEHEAIEVQLKQQVKLNISFNLFPDSSIVGSVKFCRQIDDFPLEYPCHLFVPKEYRFAVRSRENCNETHAHVCLSRDEAHCFVHFRRIEERSKQTHGHGKRAEMCLITSQC